MHYCVLVAAVVVVVVVVVVEYDMLYITSASNSL